MSLNDRSQLRRGAASARFRAFPMDESTLAVTFPVISRAPRYDVSLPVELIIAGERHQTVTEQLSFAGAFIASRVRPRFGSRVELRFVVPEPHAVVEIGAVVRWRNQRGFGVQFDGLRAGAVWSMTKWIARG
jgi:hypothetical protein